MSPAQGYRAEEICSKQVSESGQKKVLLLRRGTVSTPDEIVRGKSCPGTGLEGARHGNAHSRFQR